MTSLHALKSGDGEKVKPYKVRSVGAKVLASGSEENPDTKVQKVNAKMCMFCEKSNRAIQTCRKFREKSVTERVKYVQTNKWCFGCLKPGHHSKNCERRSVCNVCKGFPLAHVHVHVYVHVYKKTASRRMESIKLIDKESGKHLKEAHMHPQ